MVLLNEDIFTESLFLNNSVTQWVAESLLLNNGVTQWQHFRGTLALFFQMFARKKWNWLAYRRTSIFFSTKKHTVAPFWLLARLVEMHLMLNNFYLKHFWIQCKFLAAVSPKVNLLSHFSSLWCFKDANLWSPLATPVGGRHMRPLKFLYKIDFRTTFIWSIFWYNAYFCFGIVEPLSKYTFPFQYIKIKDGNFWGLLAPPLGEIRHTHPLTFL